MTLSRNLVFVALTNMNVKQCLMSPCHLKSWPLYRQYLPVSSTSFLTFWYFAQDNEKPRIVMTPTLSSLMSPQVVTTVCGATSNNKIGIMTTFHWMEMVGNYMYNSRLRINQINPQRSIFHGSFNHVILNDVIWQNDKIQLITGLNDQM